MPIIRNSGQIGKKSLVRTSAVSGIFDTFDVYNYRRRSKWPPVVSYSLSTNSGTILENTSLVITLTTTGFESDTSLYWTILHGSSSSNDFSGGTLDTSGTFTQSGSTNTGNFTINTAFIAFTSKTTKTFQIEIRHGSTSGTVVHTSGIFSIPAVTSSVSWSTSPINEGSTSSLSVTLGNIGNASTAIAYITYSGTATSADFTTFPSTMTIGSGTFTTNFTAVSDLTTEGSESLTAEVIRTIFSLGSATLSILDTSTAITATVTPTTSSVNEGSSVTFNISITSGNFSSGTLYWTLAGSGTVGDGDFSSPSNAVSAGGSVAISSSTGSVTFTLASDSTTESAAESFQFQLRGTSGTSDTIITTSSSVTINDTSQGAAAGWTGNVVSVTSTSGNTIVSLVNNYYRRYILSFVYTSAELAAAFGKNTASISGLRFLVATQPTNQPYPNYAIGMKLVSTGITTNPTNTGYTIVKSASSESFTTNTTKQFFPFSSTFNWTSGNNLAIIVAWGQSPTNYSSTGRMSFNSSGSIFYSRSDSTGSFVINTDTPTLTLTSSRPVVQLYG